MKKLAKYALLAVALRTPVAAFAAAAASGDDCNCPVCPVTGKK